MQVAPGGGRHGYRRGFTLLELIAVVVALGVLSAIAVPSFAAVRQQMRERTTVTEARALVREARPIAAFHSREFLVTEDFGANDFDRATPGVQPAVGTSPWAYTSQYAITVYIHDDGSVTDSDGQDPVGPVPTPEPTPTTSTITTPSPSPTTTVVELPTTSTDGNTTVGADLGTYVDSFNGATIVRSEAGLSITLNAANWERITVTRASSQDMIAKTSGPSTSGVLTKVSNTNVNVAIPKSEAFTLNIKYNGGSSGLSYSITAVG